MSYWPLVMWVNDVPKGMVVYIPSFAHHVDHPSYALTKSYHRYEDALWVAIRAITPVAHTLFVPYVYEGEHPPIIPRNGPSPIRLVRRQMNINSYSDE